ncbi:MAG TPA: alpha/beta hydrolase, partial [Chryseolinea sp.]|nr:alpha/beta hydrolase [Chryseolinea sp.]
MKKVILFLLFLNFLTVALAQNFEKIIIDKSDPVTGYYLAVVPKGEIESVLVLFPGFGEKPESVLAETKLHNTAFNNNILTLIVPFGNKIYADVPTINNINRALTDSIKRMQLNPDKFVIGGFSAGGTIAMRYVELCMEKPEAFPTRPKAVFTIDSPIDLIDLSKYFDRELVRNFSDVGMN